MNIGEASKNSGVSSKMIRHYETLGIIPKVGRSDSGYRIYSENDVHTLRFIRHARELGFSMTDLKQLVGLWRNKSRTSAQVKSIAREHRDELQKKLTEIQAIIATLDELVECCHGDSRPECPILEELQS